MAGTLTFIYGCAGSTCSENLCHLSCLPWKKLGKRVLSTFYLSPSPTTHHYYPCSSFDSEIPLAVFSYITMARLICTICTVLFCRINPNRLGTGSPSSATDCPDYPIIRPTIHHALRQVVDIKNRDGTLVERRRDYHVPLWRRKIPLSSIFGQGQRHPAGHDDCCQRWGCRC